MKIPFWKGDRIPVRFSSTTKGVDINITRRRIQRGIAIGTLTAFGCGIGGHAVASPANAGSTVSSSTSSAAGPEVVFSASEVAALSARMRTADSAGLPDSVDSLVVKSNGAMVAVDSRGREIQLQRGWGDAWQVAKCAAHIALVFIPGRLGYKAIKQLGGVKATAKKLVEAGSEEDFLKIVGGVAAEIVGIDGVASNCF